MASVELEVAIRGCFHGYTDFVLADSHSRIRVPFVDGIWGIEFAVHVFGAFLDYIDKNAASRLLRNDMVKDVHNRF